MTGTHDPNDLTPVERDLFAQLPRESESPAASADGIVDALRREGHFRRRAPGRTRWPIRLTAAAAAAVALFAAGLLVGARFATRYSLEQSLLRRDLTVADRVLLLQRAGSAYVTAAHGYASATATADSTAVEVANQVLRGAASAVMKSNLNGALSTQLVALLQEPAATRRQPMLWY